MLNTGQKFNVVNTLNYNQKNYKGEVNKKPSKTIPDQTMSIREILTRYAHGLPIDAGKVPVYEGEDYTPDPSKMDLADRQEYKEWATAQINSIRKNNNQVEKPAEVSSAGDETPHHGSGNFS